MQKGQEFQNVPVNRHKAELLMCHPLMWSFTLYDKTSHFNVLRSNPTEKSVPTPTTHYQTIHLTAIMFANHEKPGRKFTFYYVFKPRSCCLLIQYSICSVTAGSLLSLQPWSGLRVLYAKFASTRLYSGTPYKRPSSQETDPSWKTPAPTINMYFFTSEEKSHISGEKEAVS